MTDLDRLLVSSLRRDARASVSQLASELGVTRATVRARMDRLAEEGRIVGYTVVLKEDVQTDPVRGLMMLGVEGTGTERVMRQLQILPEVRAVHSTNGRWDLIVELGTETLEALDKVLFSIRKLPGVSQSETSLLLSTRLPGRSR